MLRQHSTNALGSPEAGSARHHFHLEAGPVGTTSATRKASRN
ncbi:MAG: hypothetical protein ABI972_26765 [Acidobacteriota bacterium]